MKPFQVEKPRSFRHFLVSLASDEPARLICAGLGLACLVVLFRIAGIWLAAF